MANDSPKVEMAQARTSEAGAASMSDKGLNLYQDYRNWRGVSNLGGQFTVPKFIVDPFFAEYNRNRKEKS